MKKKPGRSAALEAIEGAFDQHTRRFSPFKVLGLTAEGDAGTGSKQEPQEPDVPPSLVPSEPSPEIRKDAAPILLQKEVASEAVSLRVSEQVFEIPVSQIIPSPDQPRSESDPEADQELLESIKHQGVLNPIHVRRVGERYELIAGERRWRACELLGKETIPALIRTSSNDQAASQALIDNLIRSNLSPLEEARAFKSLLDRHGYHQSQLAERVGCHKSRISRALSMLKLPSSILDLLFAPGSEMTPRHAEALLPCLHEPAKLERIVKQAVKQRWSSEQIRAEIARGPRFNQGAECVRIQFRGDSGSKGFVATIRWSPNQQDKVEGVRKGIQSLLAILDQYGSASME